jgi:DNA polymerase/3'-5' exonuclease PolX
MRLRDAELYANEVVRLLSPACEQVVVCGSVRRRKPEVKDLEIVALPKRSAGRPAFGDPASALPPLEALCARLVAYGELRLDPQLKRDGPKYKRFVHPRGKIAIDLFIAAPENFGNQIAIRTGDADFSHLMVTPRHQGGLMPDHLRQSQGFLWSMDDVVEGHIVPCPSEAAFFAELGLPVPHPEHRNAAEIARLRAAYPVEVGA